MEYKFKYCPSPFQNVEIFQDGSVYLCCPSFNDYYSIGNIYKDNFEDIWNSDKAVELRSKVLNNDYSLCRSDRCLLLNNKVFSSNYDCKFEPVMKDSPIRVKFGYDYECNTACIICRDEIKRLSDEELKILDDKIDTFFIPLLKSTKVLTVNISGDPFGSRHSRKLIKRAVQVYPDLKFEFLTNGVCCSKENFINLGLTANKIDTIRVSIHAASAKTYGKVVKNGKKLFPSIIENLQFISELKKECDFPFFLSFVVMSNNYKDMPKFVELAKKYNAIPVFWEYKKDCCAYAQYRENLSVIDKTHKQHNDLVKILHHPNMYIFENSLYPKLLELQNSKYESTFEKIKNKLFKKL